MFALVITTDVICDFVCHFNDKEVTYCGNGPRHNIAMRLYISLLNTYSYLLFNGYLSDDTVVLI